jgi:hypothetical protein
MISKLSAPTTHASSFRAMPSPPGDGGGEDEELIVGDVDGGCRRDSMDGGGYAGDADQSITYWVDECDGRVATCR